MFAPKSGVICLYCVRDYLVSTHPSPPPLSPFEMDVSWICQPKQPHIIYIIIIIHYTKSGMRQLHKEYIQKLSPPNSQYNYKCENLLKHVVKSVIIIRVTSNYVATG